jgi:hypothetical protein
MSNNIFSWNRFSLLFKQHFIHNAQLLLFSTGAYVGVVFIVLSIVQVGNGLQPHGLSDFQAFLMAFVPIFAILYVGHSFPAFRSKESTISYLMTPASTLEKFAFEFISRIGLVLIVLPVLFWSTFNLQGYIFAIFTTDTFESIGLQHTVILDVPEKYLSLLYAVVTGSVLFALSLAFAGSAMFDKQPLVKTLFALAVIVMLFVGYSYIVVEHIGVGRYNPPEVMVLIPNDEAEAMRAISLALFGGTIVMLLVTFRKLKEREV